jgi:hypothetical protein
MYKDMPVTKPVTIEVELENSEFVNLDEIPENIVKNGDQEVEETTDPHLEQRTPTTAVQGLPLT